MNNLVAYLPSYLFIESAVWTLADRLGAALLLLAVCGISFSANEMPLILRTAILDEAMKALQISAQAPEASSLSASFHFRCTTSVTRYSVLRKAVMLRYCGVMAVVLMLAMWLIIPFKWTDVGCVVSTL